MVKNLDLMSEEINRIAVFILESFLHIWPYLLITIPLAVMVKLSNVSKIIHKTLSGNPLISILLATLLGAFSPFCSCGVIPVIAALLMGGVPLAPVMSFWIASPSMDPEIFFLSTAAIGWKLSVWRLAATFCISLLAGYITHVAVRTGFLGQEVLNTSHVAPMNKLWKLLWKKYIQATLNKLQGVLSPRLRAVRLGGMYEHKGQIPMEIACCVPAECAGDDYAGACASCEDSCQSSASVPAQNRPLFFRILDESWKAFALVAKFMALAFFINAIIVFYIPEDFLARVLGGSGGLSVILSSFAGIPIYTSNITALPLIGGLLKLGMNEGAALAFLIAGPTTTLSAMMAVWGITRRRVFLMYVSFSLLGAIVFGYLYILFN